VDRTKLLKETMPNSTGHYFQELGQRILESLDEDPEMEPGQADTTPGNADTEDKEPEKKRLSQRVQTCHSSGSEMSSPRSA
jgi:hypothetical protein